MKRMGRACKSYLHEQKLLQLKIVLEIVLLLVVVVLYEDIVVVVVRIRRSRLCKPAR